MTAFLQAQNQPEIRPEQETASIAPARTEPVCPVLPAPLSACIDGPGERTRLGYVRVWVGRTRKLAHVVAWENVNGPVPVGLELDHLCRNRWCRNPTHLQAVTHRVNSQRAGNRKLNHAKANAIRAAYIPRIVTQVQLAKLYGVSRRTIECVLNRKFWP